MTARHSSFAVRLAVSTLCLYRQRDASIPRLIRENPSIKNWEIMDDGYHRLDSKLVRELKALSAGGIQFSVHAPFSSINLSESDPSLRATFIGILEESICRAAEIGAVVEVMHAAVPTIFSYSYPDDARRIAASSVATLVQKGKDLGIEVVVENGVGQYDLFNTVEKISGVLEGHDEVPTCLDIGHASITGDIPNFIRHQPRIHHVHIHDNMGQHDQHLPAGKGSINWREVCRLLRENDYRGMLVAENHSIEDALHGLSHIRRILDGL